MASPKNKTFGILLLAAGLAVVLVGTSIVPMWIPVLNNSNDLDAVLAKAKAAGFPMTAEDLKPKHAVPDAENAKDALFSLPGADLNSSASSGRLAPGGKDPYFEDLFSLCFLVPHLQRLKEYDGLDMKHDLDLGYALEMREYSKLRSVGKAYGRWALVEAGRGDSDAAIAALREGNRMSRFFDNDRFMIGALVRVAILAILARSTTDIAALWQNDPVAMAKLDAFCREPVPLPETREVFRGEFYFHLSYLRNELPLTETFEDMNLDSALNRITSATVRRTGTPNNPIHRANLTVVTRTYLDLDAVMAEGRHPLDVVAWAERYQKNIPEETSSRFVHMFLPNLGDLLKVSLKAQATLATRNAAVAVFRYHAEHGKFPKSLSEVNFQGKDPYSDKDLIYTVTPYGFLVYAVGENLKDDGGYTGARVDDVCVIWPRPISP